MNRTDTPDEARAFTLKVTLVYDSFVSYSRAAPLCARAAQLLGEEALSVSRWTIWKLDHPDVLPPAVQAATEADVILVSLASGADLPIPLCVWIDAWLPRRHRRPGTMVTVIGESEALCVHPSRAEAYLQAVARQGGLDFLRMEHPLPTNGRDATSICEPVAA